MGTNRDNQDDDDDFGCGVIPAMLAAIVTTLLCVGAVVLVRYLAS